MTAIKIPREQTEFVTEEGILSFPFLFAGQAQPNQNNANMSYKCEFVTANVAPDSPIARAVAVVAQTMEGNATENVPVGMNPDGTFVFAPRPRWQRHLYGPHGRFKKLEEMDKRDHSKYPYAQGKYVLSFSKIISPTFLNMKDANLADPSIRQKYDMAVAAHAPGVKRFANPNNPADILAIEELNRTRMAGGLQPYKEADYYKVRLDVQPHEVWPGCIVRIAGRAYWEGKQHKTVLLALESVLLVRTGDRLVGERDAGAAFEAFAPAAELAPQFQQPQFPTPPAQLAWPQMAQQVAPQPVPVIQTAPVAPNWDSLV